MKMIRMEKHKNRLPGEVQSLYHRKNDESSLCHEAKETASTAIQCI